MMEWPKVHRKTQPGGFPATPTLMDHTVHCTYNEGTLFIISRPTS